MSKIIFEKLTVEEEEKVRGGSEVTPVSPEQCSIPEAIPPTKACELL